MSNPNVFATNLCEWFGWTVRWRGASRDNGYTVHVGSADSYLALYTHSETSQQATPSHKKLLNVNHIGVHVENLDKVEHLIKAAGFATYNHADYEPGRRFYVNYYDGLEIEVVSYAP